MARRMADAAYRQAQDEHRYAPHVRPINELVNELRDPGGRGWMPYVAPAHGGINARLLSVLRDPGPKTQDGTGSGYLCIENDDPTAELQCLAFEAAGIDLRDVTPWNAYPWYINRKPTAAELAAGVDPLVRLLVLLPHVQVVLLQGRDAGDTWHRLTRRHPQLVGDRQLTVVQTYHPSRQALRSSNPAVREQRRQHRLLAYQKVAHLLGT